MLLVRGALRLRAETLHFALRLLGLGSTHHQIFGWLTSLPCLLPLCRRLVRRADCTRGCKGPLLATSRRLSGLGKRPLGGAGAGPAKSPDGPQGAAAKVGTAGVVQPVAGRSGGQSARSVG